MCLLAGCTAEELPDKNGSETAAGNMLKVRIENTSQTRTAVDAENRVHWVQGDQIGVFAQGAEQETPFTWNHTTDDGTAFFSGSLPEGAELGIACYPYQEEAKLSGNRLTMEIPTEREYTFGNSSEGPMLGRMSEDGSYTFRHLCGLMQVTFASLPEGACKLQVWQNFFDPDLVGRFIVGDVTAAEPVLEANNSFDKDHLTLLFSPEEAGSNCTFYIPIPPATYSELTVKLLDANDETLWQKTTTNAVIKRGTLFRLPTVEKLNPLVEITSHESGYTFSGHETYTTLTLKGRADNFYRLAKASIQLSNSSSSVVHEEYNLQNVTGYLDSREKTFEVEVDVYPGTNTYTILWEGKNVGGKDISGNSEFVVIYEEKPVLAEAVDLGLSVKWASHNVGASKASEYGGLYIWGDPTGVDLRRDSGHYDALFNNEIDCISGNTTYDIAANKWGGEWRMPTGRELEELVDNCELAVETVDGVNGLRVTGPNGNSIFLPAAGFTYSHHDLRDRGTLCRYWSGSEYADIFGHHDWDLVGLSADLGRELKGLVGKIGSNGFGLSVRPVCGPVSSAN